MEAMQLAIADEPLPESEELLSSVTKIGGRPRFIRPLPSLYGDQLRDQMYKECFCRRCKSQLFLLAQCYCPIHDGRNRMMYIFCCNRAGCVGMGDDAWRCFTVETNLDEDDDGDNEGGAADAAGWAWGGANAFPPVATFIEPEPASPPSPVGNVVNIAEELKKAAELNEKSSLPDHEIQELEQQVDLKDKPVDIAFEEFRVRLERSPRQVMRYQRNGIPIFMDPDQTIQLVIPPCNRCGGPMGMELQLLPTALYFLHVDQHLPKDVPEQSKNSGGTLGCGADFGTISVYTCVAGCSGSTKPILSPQQEAASFTTDSVDCVIKTEFLYVEPPPKEDHAAAADGRINMRQALGS